MAAAGLGAAPDVHSSAQAATADLDSGKQLDSRLHALPVPVTHAVVVFLRASCCTGCCTSSRACPCRAMVGGVAGAAAAGLCERVQLGCPC